MKDYWSEKAPPKDQREAAREASNPPMETTMKAATRKTTNTSSRRKKRPEGAYEDFISRQHVPVDAAALTIVIDRLIDSFEAAREELEGTRKEIGS